MKLEVYIDGACEPNPGGTASFGVLVRQKIMGLEGPFGYSKVRWEDWGIVSSGPKMSNNVAEYSALIKFLEWLDNQIPEDVVIYSDSQLLVNQMNFEWNTNPDKLYYPYYQKVMTLRLALGEVNKKISYKWIPREQNLADELSVRALREVGIERRHE